MAAVTRAEDLPADSIVAGRDVVYLKNVRMGPAPQWAWSRTGYRYIISDAEVDGEISNGAEVLRVGTGEVSS